jgi:hypothetical protein
LFLWWQHAHRGRYYTLREIARFNADGLWSHNFVWFSRPGTLLATAEALVNYSSQGYFAAEFAQALQSRYMMPFANSSSSTESRVSPSQASLKNGDNSTHARLHARRV